MSAKRKEKDLWVPCENCGTLFPSSKFRLHNQNGCSTHQEDELGEKNVSAELEHKNTRTKQSHDQAVMGFIECSKFHGIHSIYRPNGKKISSAKKENKKKRARMTWLSLGWPGRFRYLVNKLAESFVFATQSPYK